jgi:hypothetical protein
MQKTVFNDSVIASYFGRLSVESFGGKEADNSNSAFFGFLQDRAIRTFAQPF